jgi:hypothetical protein
MAPSSIFLGSPASIALLLIAFFQGINPSIHW